jgi:hypothetical protein
MAAHILPPPTLPCSLKPSSLPRLHSGPLSLRPEGSSNVKPSPCGSLPTTLSAG